MTVNNSPTPAPPDKRSYRVLAIWITAFGIFCVAGPDWFYGPSWSYFASHGEPIIPAGGVGLGACFIGIGSLQLWSLWRDAWRRLPFLFFLSGFVFMAAGLLLGAEGWLGHEGLMESPLMIAFAFHKFVVGTDLENRLGQ